MMDATTRAPAPLAGRTALWRPTATAILSPVAAGVLVLLVGANSGGYFPTTWSWPGVVLAWVAALALLLTSTRISRLEAAAVSALFAYVGWVALTRLWSDAPGHTITEVQRDLMYPLALLCALLLVRRGTVALLIGAVAVALDALAVYGLLTRLLPERLGAFDPITTYRLSAPVGYWNTLGILTAMGIVLTLGFAARGRVATRAIAAAALVALGPTLYFTFSRGSVIALGLGLLALVLADTRRLQLTVTALVVLPLPAVATVLASRYHGLSTTAVSLAAASHDGHRLATLLLPLAGLAAALGAGLGLVERRVAVGTWLRRGYAAAITAVAIGAAVVVVAHFGGPATMVRTGYDSFRGPPIGINAAGSNLTTRFGSLSSNGRLTLWQAAWHDFRRSPVVGSGAGSFEWYWAAHQPTDSKARDAHSLYIETLAEMGVVGFGLIAIALLLPFGALLRARREPVLPFAVGAYVAFIAHIGVDWDWEMPVVILAGLLCAAAVLIAGRKDEATVAVPEAVRFGGVAVIAACGVLAFAGLISSNALARAQTAQSGGRLATAERDARESTTWAPWSAEPYKELGYVQQARGEVRAARGSFRKATELEPLDYDAWLGLGSASEGAARRRAFATARRLYPFNPANAGPGPVAR